MIQLSPDSTGKKVDTEELTIGANSVHRERMQIAGDSATDIAPVTAADGLLVNLGTNNDVVDTAAEASLAIIDDWDESDRAKVNPIVGQAGVQGGSGTINALTQRVVLATDQPTVPVSMASGPLPSGAATEAKQDTQITHLATIAGDTTDIETAVELLDDTVATLGTSTYTEATTKGLVIGAVRRDADTTLVDTTNEVAPLQVDANGRLKVEAFSGETLPVSGTVGVTGVATEAKQDTQITHLATIAGDTTAIETAVQIMDDWDESDRAKVNPIVGQAGVAAGAGAVGATVQRVTLASDDPAVASLSVLDDWDETDRAKVNLIVGQAGVAAGAGATGATVIRVVEANGAGKTILSAGGSAASSGNNTLVAAGSARLKVVAFSLTTLSTTAMTCIFQSGASGTELWRVVIQAPTGVSAGANLSTTVPGWLFATASATLLNLNLSSANAVHWSVSYYDEA